jgi:hypothetical protein
MSVKCETNRGRSIPDRYNFKAHPDLSVLPPTVMLSVHMGATAKMSCLHVELGLV